MIWQAIAEWFVMVLGWVTSQLPALPTPPAVLYDGAGSLNTLMGQVNGLCHWVDLSWAATGFQIVIGVWAVGLLIRVVRIFAGFFIG